MFELSEKDLLLLRGFIEKNYGIQMPPSKKIMLQTRLQKRVLQLGYNTFHQYLEFLFSPQGKNVEQDYFATVISTHKTEFFREPEHFNVLRTIILPELLDTNIPGKSETLVAWSSASSTGEEVYSIAITLYDFFKNRGIGPQLLKVIGTDISDNIVEFARKGIYNNEALSSIPLEYRHYLMRSKDPNRRVMRVAPELRAFTDFRRQNLMDAQYRVKKGLHIIFCRNVLIYFNRSNQEIVLRKLVDLLAAGGFLFIGHSETLSGMDLPLEPVQLTVYRKI